MWPQRSHAIPLLFYLAHFLNIPLQFEHGDRKGRHYYMTPAVHVPSIVVATARVGQVINTVGQPGINQVWLASWQAFHYNRTGCTHNL